MQEGDATPQGRVNGRGTTPRCAPPWSRADLAAAVALAALTLALQAPHRSRHLATWDSVLFALGMERYSVPDARPHPPGYPVYIATAKLLQPFFGDPNTTLVALSLLLSAASVALLYVLARQLAGRRAALAAAGLFALSPVLAHNAVLASSYTGEGFFTVAVALACWKARTAPGTRSAAVLGAVFLLALGVRQSLLFYLTPLVAWALLAPPVDRTSLLRRGAAFAAASLAVGLLWLVPMVALSGGLRPYLAATSLQSRLVVFSESVFTDGRAAWDDHWARLMLYLHPEAVTLLPALLALAACAGLAILAARRRGLPPPAPAPSAASERTSEPGTAAFLALWTLPAVAFYLLVFNGWDRGPDGYALVLLPGAYLAFACAAEALGARLESSAGRWRRAATVAVLLALMAPASGLAMAWEAPMKEVRDHDAWTESWQRLETDFPANGTAIVASYSWAHAKWFFPDHILWSRLAIPPGPSWDGPWTLTMQTRHREDDVSFYEAHLRGPVETQHPIPDGIDRVVLLDFQLAGENGGVRTVRPEVAVHEGLLSNGWRFLYFETDAAHPTIESYFADS